jgi:hypothetical protein
MVSAMPFGLVLPRLPGDDTCTAWKSTQSFPVTNLNRDDIGQR